MTLFEKLIALRRQAGRGLDFTCWLFLGGERPTYAIHRLSADRVRGVGAPRVTPRVEPDPPYDDPKTIRLHTTDIISEWSDGRRAMDKRIHDRASEAAPLVIGTAPLACPWCGTPLVISIGDGIDAGPCKVYGVGGHELTSSPPGCACGFSP